MFIAKHPLSLKKAVYKDDIEKDWKESIVYAKRGE